jgi:hypothetical protein
VEVEAISFNSAAFMEDINQTDVSPVQERDHPGLFSA